MKTSIPDRQSPATGIKEEVDSQACVRELQQQINLDSNYLHYFHAWLSNLDRIVKVDYSKVESFHAHVYQLVLVCVNIIQ